MARAGLRVVALAALLAALCAASVRADMYLQNPRGSNDRLDEANRARDNANRLFDSQDNQRGGYNVGSLYYYAGSVLQIEWTNQHSCGDQNCYCNIIIQYTCDPTMRDGTTTGTIPVNRANCQNYDCDTDVRYGRHESLSWYNSCQYRSRNRGLFTADQNPNGAATSTRQNPNGDRHGYECPEERDYYPYWYPTPWYDIAILTNDATRCPYYQSESQNVKGRYWCNYPATTMAKMIQQGRTGFIPITEAACNVSGGVWTYQPPWGIAPPTCMESIWTHDNHLGNTYGGLTPNYNWTIPDTLIGERCVLRIRYNISTNDYLDWQPGNGVSTLGRGDEMASSANNSQVPWPDPNVNPANLDVWSRFGLSYSDVEASFTSPSANAVPGSREYVFRNDPNVDIFGRVWSINNGSATYQLKLQLAIDTAQFGRTFQDRSHTFAIRPMPESMAGCGHLYNINVRGKRGNIVQVFPATEYDFTPNAFQISNEDCVHIQWTGSNTNPDDNEGEGKAGTDRSNLVALLGPTYYEYVSPQNKPTVPVVGHWARNYPNYINIPSQSFLGLPYNDLFSLAFNYPAQFGGNLKQLDDTGTYFDLGPRAVTQLGWFYYMCTRNNDFTNRSQKAKIMVLPIERVSMKIGWMGGTVSTSDGSAVQLPQGTLLSQMQVTVEAMPATENVNISGSIASRFVVITMSVPQNASDAAPLFTSPNSGMFVSVAYDAGISRIPELFYSPSIGSEQYYKIASATTTGALMSAAVNQPGVYFVSTSFNYAPVVAGVVCSVVIVGAIIATILYYRHNPDKWQATKRKFANFRRSFASQV